MPEAVRDSVGELVPEQVEAPAARPEPVPPRSQRRLIQLTVDQGTYDKLSYAQALLSHAIPSGDVAQVLDRALDALIRETEKRRFAATKKPRPRQSSTANRRHVPSHVKRAVWERDQGQCTFVSSTGHRCSARKFLEFDHVDPVARGGHASVDRMRLRCRAHNQYEAERVFGAGFMGEKRDEARRAKEARTRDVAAEARRVAAQQQARDVYAGLRALGFRADEARRAVECSATGHGTTLEERIRAALRFLGRKPVPPAESRRAERRPGGSWGAGAGPGPSGSARSAMSSIGSP
jgi:5-methylcytosine-specific restriction endonuclease McrA